MRFHLRPYSIEAIDSPAETLSAIQQKQLVDELTRVGKSAFGSQMTREDVAAHTMPIDTLFVVRKGERIIGFSSNKHLKLPSGEMLYLAGTGVDREHSGKGIYGIVRPFSVLYAISHGHNFAHVSSRTQSPIVYASLSKLGIHPRPGVKLPKHVKEAAAHLAKHLSPEKPFDPKTLVIRGAFGSSLYDSPPLHHDKKLNNFVYRRVKLQEGDGLLMVAVTDRQKAEETFLSAASKINKTAAKHLVERLR